jgi:hypothetical protein
MRWVLKSVTASSSGALRSRLTIVTLAAQPEGLFDRFVPIDGSVADWPDGFRAPIGTSGFLLAHVVTEDSPPPGFKTTLNVTGIVEGADVDREAVLDAVSFADPLSLIPVGQQVATDYPGSFVFSG